MVDDSFGALLARQAGVLSRAQALAAGIPARVVDDRVRSRRWEPVHPRVYRVRRGADEDVAAVWAAMLWAGPDAVLTGAAAAWWHGLTFRPPATLRLSTGPHRRALTRPGVRREPRLLDPRDVTVVAGLAVTAVALTVLEAAVERGLDADGLRAAAVAARVGTAQLVAAHQRTGGATAARLLRDIRHSDLAACREYS